MLNLTTATQCTCDADSACENWEKHVNYLWMQFADVSFKNKGAFWSEFSTQCGKLSPTQSTEELGCWTDCFPAFFLCRETGVNALFLCSEYCKFQVRESSLCSQISLVQSICVLLECCRALLPSFPQLLPLPPFLAGWESSSTEEQTRRWIWAAQCLQMIFFDEIEKNFKYFMLALLGPSSHSDNQWRKQDITVTVWQVHEELH